MPKRRRDCDECDHYKRKVRKLKKKSKRSRRHRRRRSPSPSTSSSSSRYSRMSYSPDPEGEFEQEYPPTMPESPSEVHNDVTLPNQKVTHAPPPLVQNTTQSSLNKQTDQLDNAHKAPPPLNSEVNDNSTEPILDPNLLEILGKDPSSKPQFGKELHKELASRLEHIAITGLTKEARKELLDKYLIPSNCTGIGAPLMNPEIKAAIPDMTEKRDKALELRQKQVASVITCLGQTISHLMQEKDTNSDLLKQLMDATRMLCDLQYSDSMKRRYFAFSTLKKDINDHLMQTKIDKFLFGENLAETLKAAKAVSKSGAEIKSNPQGGKNIKKPAAQPQPSTSRNLNWRAPPPARRQQGAVPAQGTQQRTRPPAPARKHESSSRQSRYQYKRARHQ